MHNKSSVKRFSQTRKNVIQCIILGLTWNVSNDSFILKFDLHDDNICTKRTVLRDSAKICDPQEWLSSCVIIFTKIMVTKIRSGW